MGEQEHEGSLLSIEVVPTESEVEVEISPTLGLGEESKENDRSEGIEDVRFLEPSAISVDPMMDESVKGIEQEDEA
jgi:hypothetical protein